MQKTSPQQTRLQAILQSPLNGHQLVALYGIFTLINFTLLCLRSPEVSLETIPIAILLITLSYCLAVALLTTKERNAIARTLWNFQPNQARLPQILFASSIAVTMVIALAKAKHPLLLQARMLPLEKLGLLDGLMGISTSICAASAVQILEMWRTFREKEFQRVELLHFLGIDARAFDRKEDSKVLLVLPFYKWPEIPKTAESEHDVDDLKKQLTETEIHDGPYAKSVGSRNKIGLNVEKLCAAADVVAYQHIAQTLFDHGIQWDLLSAEEALNLLKIDITKDYNQTAIFPKNHFVCIGLYSNLLAATIFLKDSQQASRIPHALPNFSATDTPCIKNPDGSISPPENQDTYVLIYRRQYNQDRANAQTGSILIFGAVSANGTEQAGKQFPSKWKEWQRLMETPTPQPPGSSHCAFYYKPIS
jgi:hypothetical protein